MVKRELYFNLNITLYFHREPLPFIQLLLQVLNHPENLAAIYQ